MRANWRVAMFALLNFYTSVHRHLSARGELNPTELLVYVTVSVANVQKLMRERTIPANFSATAVLPREWVVPISRNAVAAATGLPRETVRRTVGRLIEQGWLIEDARGGVTPPPGFITDNGLEPLLGELMTDFQRAAETLLRLGVIRIGD